MKPTVRPERRAHVRIWTTGQRDSTSRVRDAQHDESHRDRADEIRNRRCRAERTGNVRWQAEDTAANRDVDDGRGQSERADGANQRIPARRRLRVRGLFRNHDA